MVQLLYPTLAPRASQIKTFTSIKPKNASRILPYFFKIYNYPT